MDSFTLCRCGCGSLIPFINKRCQEARFKHGHNNSGGKFKKGHITWSWKGGKKLSSDGYIVIRSDEFFKSGRRKYVREHRLVMEKYIGRKLEKYEDVHHINGDKQDNRIENLELMSHSEHMIRTHRIDMSDRFCLNCGSKKTYLDSKRKRPRWYKHPIIKDMWMCMKCHENMRINL